VSEYKEVGHAAYYDDISFIFICFLDILKISMYKKLFFSLSLS